MTYKIDNELCTMCEACKDECPAEAIKDKDGTMFITEECTDCGSCAEVCPAEAIKEGK